MRTKVLAGLGVCMSLAVITGCGGLEALYRPMDVVDNVLISDSPALKLKIGSEFVYKGKIEQGGEMHGARNYRDPTQDNLARCTHVFVQESAGGQFARGIVVRLYTVGGDPLKMTTALHPCAPDELDSGMVAIGDEAYASRIFLTGRELFRDGEGALISGTRCFVVQSLERAAGFGNKSRIQILYLEPAMAVLVDQGCSPAAYPGRLTQAQEHALAGFRDRSLASLQFPGQGPPRQEGSTSVRRADTPAPAASDGPPAVLSQPDPLATKLRLLKDLREQDLITQEDYDRKKAELLDEF